MSEIVFRLCTFSVYMYLLLMFFKGKCNYVAMKLNCFVSHKEQLNKISLQEQGTKSQSKILWILRNSSVHCASVSSLLCLQYMYLQYYIMFLSARLS